MVGIVGYGAYIPCYRLKMEEIAAAWSSDSTKIFASLALHEKAIAASDEDTTTIAVQAAEHALIRAGLSPEKVGALYVGSESHAYAVKPTATIVGTALGCSNNYLAADFEFACKGATAAIQAAYGLVASDTIAYALAIGADVAQAAPGDVLEYSAAAGGAALLLGNKESELLAVIEKTISVSSDTPDFWRRSLEQYPEHLGRFTAEPAYFAHVYAVTEKILSENSSRPSDFDYVIFHQPNGKFPVQAAKKFGFSTQQLQLGLICPQIGNSYSATALLGLTAVFDQAKEGQKILLISYGSGSGSDAFIISTTSLLEKKQKSTKTTAEYMHNKKYVSYQSYRQMYAVREGMRQ